MASTLNASTSGVGGVITTADNSGDLNIQSGGSTKIAVTSAGVAVTGLSKGSLPTGSVLQVVTKTDTAALSTSSATFTATGTYHTITPLYATSKILVMINGILDTDASGREVTATIYRDSTNLATNGLARANGAASRVCSSGNMMIVDSPNTTSSVRYEAYIKTSTAAAVEWNGSSITNTITLMEIAA
jgi:hypothetical protein